METKMSFGQKFRYSNLLCGILHHIIIIKKNKNMSPEYFYGSISIILFIIGQYINWRHRVKRSEEEKRPKIRMYGEDD